MANEEKAKANDLLGAFNAFIKNAGDVVNDVTGKVGNAVNDAAGAVGSAVNNAAGAVGGAVSDVAGKIGGTVSGVANKGMQAVVNTVDLNGNGTIDIEDFIIMGLKIPGVCINREAFLRAELKRSFPDNVIDEAVENNPAQADIPVEEINKIADGVIAYERNCVSGISTVLGMPGGFAMAASIPADITQYYGFMLRAAQKLLYLYGFPQIDIDERDQMFDSETLNMLTLCLGVMYGVAGANKMLMAIANALAKGVEKQLLKKALTKGAVYPIVKNIAKWFGQKMTKQVFAGFFKKAIPVVGGLVGGSITYLSFKPCCDKLRDSLKDTILSNPESKTVIETELVFTDEQDEILEKEVEE